MNSTLTDTTDLAATDLGERRRLMTELSITHHGRYYHFDGYRYELLADAIAFAQLVRALPSTTQRATPALEKFDAVEEPSAADRQLMQQLSISFENYRFVFEGYHYDRLIDAANYARQRRQPGAKAP